MVITEIVVKDLSKTCSYCVEVGMAGDPAELCTSLLLMVWVLRALSLLHHNNPAMDSMIDRVNSNRG